MRRTIHKKVVGQVAKRNKKKQRICPLKKTVAILLREALFTFVGKSKTDVPSVSQLVRPDFGVFYQKNMRGGHMPLNSESLKHRF